MLVQVGLAGMAAMAVPALLVRQHVRALLHFGEQGGEKTPRPEDLTPREKLAVLVRGASVPKPSNRRTPADLGHAFETRHVHTADGHRLEVWTVPGEQGRGQVLLYHGYTEPKEQVLGGLAWFRGRGFTVHLVDFRASGGSTGQRTTLGVEEARDVVTTVRWAAARTAGPLVVYGFSMGGAAILGALGRHDLPVDAAIVDGVYDSLANTLAHRFRTMGLPPSPGRELLMLAGSVELRRNAWRVAPVQDARTVHRRTLVLVGEQDPRVSVDDATAIARALPYGTLATLPRGDHAPAFESDPEAWERAVAPFLGTLGGS